ncbi:hypothetical protein C8R46DRAFT_1216064 [Mycena filopes]|nr:hypothetical protein C8R46DRAFT_1216064 [Mycena filopes]
MFSAIFAASPAAPSSLVSLVSGFVFLMSTTLLLALKNTESDLYAGSTPSRTSGIPTPVLLQQNDRGFFFKSLLIIICFTVTLASGSWARSPRSGRLKREGSPPLPPPPPPPPQQIPMGDLTADEDDADGHAGNGDDGEDDPDQEGDGDGQTERDGDGHQVGAAPAPEDPPPPGGLEDEEGDNNFNPDGLPWLVLLVMGSILLAVTKRLWRRNSRETTSVKKLSAKIPGLLERQIAVVDDLVCAYKAPSIVQGLLLRAQPTLVSIAHLYTTVNPTFPAASSLTSVAREAWRIFTWRKAYILLAVLPGLGFLLAILRLLPLQNRHRIPEIVAERPALAPEPVTPRNRRLIPPPTTPRRPRRRRVARLEPIAWPAPEPDDDPHLEPRAPPPSPVSPQRQPPLPPLPFRDPATQAVCQNMLTLIEQKTALRTARAQDLQVNESTKRVREVQRRIWGLLCELHEESASAEEV